MLFLSFCLVSVFPIMHMCCLSAFGPKSVEEVAHHTMGLRHVLNVPCPAPHLQTEDQLVQWGRGTTACSPRFPWPSVPVATSDLEAGPHHNFSGARTLPTLVVLVKWGRNT